MATIPKKFKTQKKLLKRKIENLQNAIARCRKSPLLNEQMYIESYIKAEKYWTAKYEDLRVLTNIVRPKRKTSHERTKTHGRR